MSTTTRCAIFAQFIVLVLGTRASAQTAVPSQYQDLYNQLQTSMQGVEGQLQPGTPGQTKFTFSAESLYADGNIGLSLLKPGARDSYLHELQSLKSLGVSGVVVEMGFPLLYQPFYDSIGQPQAYQQMLAFFQQVVVDIHSLGLKAIIETQCLFPGYYSQLAGFDLTTYYPTLSLSDFEAGRAAQAATIYSQVKPDYLDLGSEPDTEANNAGRKEFLDPNVWAQAIASYVQALPAGVHNPPVGAGVGNWRVNDGIQFVQAEAAVPGLDYIDLHGYPVVNEGSTNTFQYLLQLINAAQGAGKPVAMSEFWLLKIASSTNNNSQDPSTASLNAYSFFQPLDQEFLTDMWRIGNQYKFIYGSAFWSRYFWNYVPYSSSAPTPGAALDQAAQKASRVALFAGQKDGTAAQVQTITGVALSSGMIVSSADYSTEVAVDSLASIFGSNLATTTAEGQATNLGGVTVNVTDSSGAAQAAQLLYVSPTQINFVIPAGLQSGIATVSVASGSGSPQNVGVTLSTTAPGFFTENSGATQIAAGETATADSNGNLTYQYVFNCGQSTCQATPINVSGGNVYLVLFGTGIRHAKTVSVTVNGQTVSAQFAAQSQFPGVDQVNVLLPATLAGAGLVSVEASADGIPSNAVEIQIQ